MIKNNIIRYLESRKIKFTSFELPPEKLSAIQTASILNVPPDRVFKSIIISREKKGKQILAIVPGSVEVDLKKLATFLGEKKLYVPSEREVEQITGLLVGGISPLALIGKGFEMVLDQSALLHDEIHISGGQRGLNLLIHVQDLIALITPKTADITQKSE